MRKQNIYYRFASISNNIQYADKLGSFLSFLYQMYLNLKLMKVERLLRRLLSLFDTFKYLRTFEFINKYQHCIGKLRKSLKTAKNQVLCGIVEPSNVDDGWIFSWRLSSSIKSNFQWNYKTFWYSPYRF